jgi:hypothetical protein
MRQRSADDVETINARLQELRKEREQAIGDTKPGSVDTEQDGLVFVDVPPVVWPFPLPGEFTDGA